MTKEIPLLHGKVTIVDDEDYEHLSTLHWTLRHNSKKSHGYYAAHYYKDCLGVRHSFSMHRLLLCVQDENTLVDHIDGNGLNNVRSNLRVATYSQNTANRHDIRHYKNKYIGVYTHTQGKNWYATIAGTRLGSFPNQEEAAVAYDNAAKIRYGAFARLNFPE